MVSLRYTAPKNNLINFQRLKDFIESSKDQKAFRHKMYHISDDTVHNMEDSKIDYGDTLLYLHFGTVNKQLFLNDINLSVKNLIRSFLYTADKEKTDNWKYKLQEIYPQVIIVLFLTKESGDLTNHLIDALEGDPFGKRRKVYIVTIPVMQIEEINEQLNKIVVEAYVKDLLTFLRTFKSFEQMISHYPNSKFAVQEYQEEDDGFSANMKKSRAKALKIGIPALGEFTSNNEKDVITTENLLSSFFHKNYVGEINPDYNNTLSKLLRFEEKTTSDDYSSRHNKRKAPLISLPVRTDKVSCSVFSPKKVKSASEFLVQVFAHTDSQAILLNKMAGNVDRKSVLRKSSNFKLNLQTGSVLMFKLEIGDLIIDDPVLSISWESEVTSVEFGVKVPKTATQTEYVGKVLVLADSIPIGTVKFTISIDQITDQELIGTETSMNSLNKFKHAFVSYASPDRSEVLKRVQMLKLAKIDFFHDLLSLDPGERWEKMLYQNIDKSDVFFLFWSTAARDSKWVLQEVLYALEKQKKSGDTLPEIIPVIIEAPPVQPPAELNFLHFNDTLIYLINADTTPTKLV
jgi:TIR domain